MLFRSAVKAIVALLPLLLKLSLVILKYKRAVKKREKIFRRTFKKEGLPPEVIDKLCDDLPEITIREMVGQFR